MMTVEELQTRRIRLWHATPESALEKPKEIVAFLRELRWCFLIPKKLKTYPSLLHAITGVVECPVSPSRLASLRLLIGDLWEYPPMVRSIVEIYAVGRAPMLVTREFCKNICVFLFEGRKSPQRLVRERQLTALEAEILSLVRTNACSKIQFRQALNIHTRNGNAELEQALRSLVRRLFLLRIGIDEAGRPVYRSTATILGIHSYRSSQRQRRRAAVSLIIAYLDAVVADSRVGIKSFFRGIIPPELIDGVLYDLLLRSVLRVEPNLIINGKKALFHR
ncbi:MAG: hypothetical protein ABSB78_07365 [Bacteroidota bacterium]